MSFREMTITLDDVTTLLHIPPYSKFFDAPINTNTNKVVIVAHELLAETLEEAFAEIIFHKCAQYRL